MNRTLFSGGPPYMTTRDMRIFCFSGRVHGEMRLRANPLLPHQYESFGPCTRDASSFVNLTQLIRMGDETNFFCTALDFGEVEFTMPKVDHLLVFVPSSAVEDEELVPVPSVTRTTPSGAFPGECCRLFAAARLAFFPEVLSC
jgi:hypothetical protein